MSDKLQNILLLHFRNFGDAVVALGLVESVHRSNPGVAIDVLTRSQFRFLFESHPGIRRVYTARFPIGTIEPFPLSALPRLARELAGARARRYDAVVNLFGDVRENLAGWWIAPAGNYAPVWHTQHPVRLQSRIGPNRLLSHPVLIGGSRKNLYEAVGELASALGTTVPAKPALYGGNRRPIPNIAVARRVGLHVSAGQECRRWPLDNWRKLASALLEDGCELRVYCAPAERNEVASVFAGELVSFVSIALVCGTLQEFLEDLATCAVFLGHDSFGIHAAAAVGVPSIMINGPNVAEVWAPPGTEVVHGDESLSCFPCYSKPVCGEGPDRFACIRRIGVPQVHRLVQISVSR